MWGSLCYLNAIFSELASLVQTAIEKVNQTGAVIICVTCDNPAVNLSMLTQLGANISHKNLKSSLDCENNLNIPIFATLDACHLMKLIRNCFATYKELSDSDGNIISWSFIEELQRLQQYEGFHLANKLRKKHIQWDKNKMKTALAVQVFSKSVADSLDYCRKILKLEGLKEVMLPPNF